MSNVRHRQTPLPKHDEKTRHVDYPRSATFVSSLGFTLAKFHIKHTIRCCVRLRGLACAPRATLSLRNLFRGEAGRHCARPVYSLLLFPSSSVISSVISSREIHRPASRRFTHHSTEHLNYTKTTAPKSTAEGRPIQPPTVSVAARAQNAATTAPRIEPPPALASLGGYSTIIISFLVISLSPFRPLFTVFPYFLGINVNVVWPAERTAIHPNLPSPHDLPMAKLSPPNAAKKIRVFNFLDMIPDTTAGKTQFLCHVRDRHSTIL